MNLLNKYMIFCAILLILLPVILSTINSDNITATDWIYRHSEWIKYYLRGDFRPMIDYPPLFHWMMLPFVAMDFPIKYFQIIFAVLTILSIVYYLKKCENEKIMLLSLMLLATAITFIEYIGSLMPQGLDYFFFCLMIVFYFRGKDKYAIILGIIISLMHIIGLLFILILMAHAFLTKRKSWKKYLMVSILILPIFTFYFVPKYLTSEYFIDYNLLEVEWDFSAQAEWESQFLQPLNFIIYSGFLIWALLPFALKNLYKRKFKLTETELLYVIWILAFVSLSIGNYGIWRMISYQMLPISLLVASLISDSLIE